LSDRYSFGGLATGFGVGREDVVDGIELGARRVGEDGFNDFGDAEEWKAVVEKSSDSDFIGGVEGAGECTTLLQGFASETETGKSARGGFLEVEAAEFGPVELDLLRLDAGGIGERVLDGHAHIRRSELSEDGAVDELDEGMDGGLGMDDDIDLIGAKTEEPAGFDNFKAFVHHRGGIDGDAVAHAPVGVGEGLVDGDVGKLRERSFAKWAAGSGEDDAADFIAGADAETLVDGVVLGIDGKEFFAGFSGSGHDQFTGGDEDFFVGESDGAAEFDGFVSGFEADHAYGGGENDFGGGMSADGEHAFAPVMDGGERRIIGFTEAASEFVGEFFIGDGDHFGAVAQDLGEQLVEIGAGGEGHDFQSIGLRLNHGESLTANGAGRPEDGNGL